MTADRNGLVAVTSELTVDLLLDAYEHGLFPWSEGPVRWYSPDPRTVFLRDRVHLPRNLDKIARREEFVVTFDQVFTEVVRACGEAHAHEGEWITGGFVKAYGALHDVGHAHSVEVWQGDRLAGGLYGVQLRGLFSGESMFYRVANASKVAFKALLQQLDTIGTQLIDAQVMNPHTANLGALWMRRRDYLRVLSQAMQVCCKHEGAKWPSRPPPTLGAKMHRRCT